MNVEDAVGCLLTALSREYGFDQDDPNFADTPSRVANAWGEILGGYKEDPGQILSANFPSDDYDQMIVVKDIKFFSVCAHHMLPFYGSIAVGYIPGKIQPFTGTGDQWFGDEDDKPESGGKVVGLSKIARICHAFAKRFQIQERLTQQIATAIADTLKPRGVGVLVYDSIHLCMHMRGIRESHSTMDTSALYGEFREDAAVRAEFFRMVGR